MMSVDRPVEALLYVKEIAEWADHEHAVCR